jgi:hypothetical protein
MHRNFSWSAELCPVGQNLLFLDVMRCECGEIISVHMARNFPYTSEHEQMIWEHHVKESEGK